MKKKRKPERVTVTYADGRREEVEPTHFRRRTERKETTKLRLTKEQKAKLFNHEPVTIAGEGECPVGPGYSRALSSRLTLTVVKVRARKGGGWSLGYVLTDTREDKRILRRTPPIHVDRGEAPTAESIAQAARESSYTSMPTSLSDAGEAIDEVAQKRMSAQAHRNKGQQQTVNRLSRERYEMERRLERARSDAESLGVDISSPLRVIERQLRKIEGRVYDGRAA